MLLTHSVVCQLIITNYLASVHNPSIAIVTYGAEVWTSTELRGKIEAFEIQCYRRSVEIP